MAKRKIHLCTCAEVKKESLSKNCSIAARMCDVSAKKSVSVHSRPCHGSRVLDRLCCTPTGERAFRQGCQCSHSGPRRQIVGRSKGGHLHPLWSTIVEQRWWLTAPATSHLESAVFNPPFSPCLMMVGGATSYRGFTPHTTTQPPHRALSVS